MTPAPPEYVRIHLDNFKPSFIGEDPFKPGFVIGSDNGVLAFTDEDGNETKKRHQASEKAINGVAGIGGYLAVSTGEEVTIFEFPPDQDGTVRSSVIPQGAHGVVAAGGSHFLAPVGHEGLLVVTPTAESIAHNRINSFPGTPLNFYQLCGLPPFSGKYYFVAACRSGGIGIVDMSTTSPETGLRVGVFADVVDVAYLGNGNYPYAIAAVGMSGELFLCRDIVRQEPPITLHYQNLAGRVYRVLTGHGHVFILTSKALYVLGNLAKRLIQPVFDASETPFMTIPMDAIDAAVVGDNKWLLIVMSDSIRRYDIDLLNKKMAEFARNGEIKEAFSSQSASLAWTQREPSLVG